MGTEFGDFLARVHVPKFHVAASTTTQQHIKIIVLIVYVVERTNPILVSIVNWLEVKKKKKKINLKVYQKEIKNFFKRKKEDSYLFALIVEQAPLFDAHVSRSAE